MITRDDHNDESVAERLIARERVILDRELELYRLRHLAGATRIPRPRQVEAEPERPEAPRLFDGPA